MNSLNGVMVVGLTGQTGAGKSTVSKIFASNGFTVINCETALSTDAVLQALFSLTSPSLKHLPLLHILTSQARYSAR